VIYIS
jgi:hypothetical protein